MAATLTPQQLASRLDHADLIDVRTPAEFRAVHVRGARLAPLDQLDPGQVAASRPADATGPTLILCKSGRRAAQAAQQLATFDHEALVVEGGTEACVAAGLPVQRGKRAVSLERQVRIAAGSLVFVGTALAYFVHPAFLVLPGFVGAGLVFAGVTDTCGMGLLLARMPWNR
ncbi:MAG: rhodanese family protein [Planctomycetota bacterium]